MTVHIASQQSIGHRPDKDIFFIPGAKGAILDPTSDPENFTVTKMGIDATRKWVEEGYTGRWPDEIKMDSDTKRRVDEIWRHLKIDTPNKKQ